MCGRREYRVGSDCGREGTRHRCSSSTRTTSRTAAPTRLSEHRWSRPRRSLSCTTAGAAGISALYGPLARRRERGGPQRCCARFATAIDRRTREFMNDAKDRKAGEGRLMGFGHRVYKNYDPRARIHQVDDRRPGLRGHRHAGSPARSCPGISKRIALDRRVLRGAQAVPERRLLQWHCVRAIGIPETCSLSCCAGPFAWLDRSVARDEARAEGRHRTARDRSTPASAHEITCRSRVDRNRASSLCVLAVGIRLARLVAMLLRGLVSFRSGSDRG